MKIIWFTPWDEALNCYVTYRAAATLELMPLNTCNLSVFFVRRLKRKAIARSRGRPRTAPESDIHGQLIAVKE